MENEIRKQFELGCCGLRPQDHRMLECTMESIIRMNLKAQKYWIRKCTVSREYTEKSERNVLVGMRNIMNAWATIPD